jgi:hypothetical protein
MIERSNITNRTPIRLATAAELAFPDGSMTVSGLRSEARKGKLVTWRVAGKDYTTMGEIDDMLERCRTPSKLIETLSSSPKSSDKSEAGKIAQAAARLHLAKRKR